MPIQFFQLFDRDQITVPSLQQLLDARDQNALAAREDYLRRSRDAGFPKDAEAQKARYDFQDKADVTATRYERLDDERFPMVTNRFSNVYSFHRTKVGKAKFTHDDYPNRELASPPEDVLGSLTLSHTFGFDAVQIWTASGKVPADHLLVGIIKGPGGTSATFLVARWYKDDQPAFQDIVTRHEPAMVVVDTTPYEHMTPVSAPAKKRLAIGWQTALWCVTAFIFGGEGTVSYLALHWSLASLLPGLPVGVSIVGATAFVAYTVPATIEKVRDIIDDLS